MMTKIFFALLGWNILGNVVGLLFDCGQIPAPWCWLIGITSFSNVTSANLFWLFHKIALGLAGFCAIQGIGELAFFPRLNPTKQER